MAVTDRATSSALERMAVALERVAATMEQRSVVRPQTDGSALIEPAAGSTPEWQMIHELRAALREAWAERYEDRLRRKLAEAAFLPIAEWLACKAQLDTTGLSACDPGEWSQHQRAAFQAFCEWDGGRRTGRLRPLIRAALARACPICDGSGTYLVPQRVGDFTREACPDALCIACRAWLEGERS